MKIYLTCGCKSNLLHIIICKFFNKVFDGAKHDILLNKLHRYGIRRGSNHLIKSYLNNIYQRVFINSCSSHFLLITIVVAQGSSIGLLLYLACTKDMINILKDAETVMFAGDTVITANDKDLNELPHRINRLAFLLFD